jgi:hypothetical protein
MTSASTAPARAGITRGALQLYDTLWRPPPPSASLSSLTGIVAAQDVAHALECQLLQLHAGHAAHACTTLRLTVPPLSRNSSSIASLVTASSASSLLPPPCSPPPFCQRSRVFRSALAPACNLTGEEPQEWVCVAAGTGVDARGCAGRAGDGVGRAALEAARLLLAGEKYSGVAATGEGRGARGARLLRKLIAGAVACEGSDYHPLFCGGGRALRALARFNRPLAGNGSWNCRTHANQVFGCDCLPQHGMIFDNVI